MQDFDKTDLITHLLMSSEVTEDNKSDIQQCEFEFHNLDSIKFKMKGRETETQFQKRYWISTIPINGFSMKDIVTRRKNSIWNTFLTKKGKWSCEPDTRINREEIKMMLSGTKLHRRLMSHRNEDELAEFSDNEDDDPDYIPPFQEEFSDTDSDNEIDLTIITEQNLSTVSSVSTGQSCIKKILVELKKIDNKNHWRNENVDSLVQKYFSSKNNLKNCLCMKWMSLLKL